MQVIQIDLKKNPEIADFVVDKEPGDRICVYGSIKSLSDQLLEVTVEEVEEDKTPENDETDDTGGNEGSGLEGEDSRNPQGDSVTPAGTSPDAVRDIAGGEQSAT